MRKLALLLLLFLACVSPKLIIKKLPQDNKLSGKILWDLKLPSSASATITCYDGYILVPLLDKKVVIIDATTGMPFTTLHADFLPRSSLLTDSQYYISGIGEWNTVTGYSLQNEITRLFQKSADPLGGFLSSSSEGPMFATNRGKLFLIDNHTGEIVSKRNFYKRPVGVVTRNNTGYILLQNGSIYSFKFDSTLSLQDSLKLDTPIEAPPVIDTTSATIFIATWHGELFALDTTLRKLWSEKIPNEVEFPPGIHQNYLYLLDTQGNLTILDKNTGQTLNTIKKELQSFLPPVACGEEIVILGNDGTIVGYRGTGIKSWSLEVSGIPEFCSTFCQGRLYVATDKEKLYCID